MNVRSFFAAFVLGSLIGCSCGPAGVDARRYACTTDDECGAGWVCNGSFCEPVDGGAGGGTGGGVGGGMGGGTGGGENDGGAGSGGGAGGGTGGGGDDGGADAGDDGGTDGGGADAGFGPETPEGLALQSFDGAAFVCFAR
jgi:hypothetical protein